MPVPAQAKRYALSALSVSSARTTRLGTGAPLSLRHSSSQWWPFSCQMRWVKDVDTELVEGELEEELCIG
jgi:hypothetical protein